MSGPFSIRDREYEARCTHVGDHVIESKDGSREERATLQIHLLNVSPSDLRESPLKRAAFIECLEPQQISLTEITAPSEEERAELVFDAKHQSMAFSKGERADETCSYNIKVTAVKGALKDNLEGGTILVRPRNGFKIKEIIPSPVQMPGAPRVDIHLSVKGAPYGIKGLGWREDDFTVSFYEKNASEQSEDTPQPKKRGRPAKVNDKQGNLELEEEDGDTDEDEEPAEEAGADNDAEAGAVDGALVNAETSSAASDGGRLEALQVITVDDLSPKDLNALPTGVIVQFKHDCWIRRNGASAGFENQATKKMSSATELLKTYAGQPVIVHAPKRIKLPDWAEGVRRAASNG